MRFRLGWHPIGCSWITPRLKFSGAHLLVDDIRSRLSGPHWQHWRAASFFDPRPRGLHWCWHVHEDARHSRRQSVLRGSRSGACGDLCHDMPCWPWFVHWLSARWTTATRFSLVFPATCKTGCSPSWMPQPFGFLSEAVRTHNPIASRTALVESSRASHIPTVCCGLPLSSWNSAGVPCWQPASLLWTSNVDTRHRLHSADSAMLVVPSTRRSPLGDRAFQWLRHVHETACRRLSVMHRHWQCSIVSWRLYFSGRRLTMIKRSWL